MGIKNNQTVTKTTILLGLIVLIGILILGVFLGPGFKFDGSQSLSSPALSPTPSVTVQPSSTPTVLPPTQPPTLTPTPIPARPVWIDPALPSILRNEVVISDDFIFSNGRDEAILEVTLKEEGELGMWTYVLVSPFPSLAESIPFQKVRSFWQGDSPGLYDNTPIHMSESTLRVLSDQWGHPAPGSVEVLPSDSLLDRLWAEPDSWAILPFQKLTPRWKVIDVDHASPLKNGFQPESYPLSFAIGVSGPERERSLFIKQNPLLENRQSENLTHIMMTGVTAMVRDTASLMEENGVRYPGLRIADVLRSADITHISNEVPFAEDCPAPGEDQAGYYFCSKDRYIELLDFVGTDVVELSGDHFGDWGEEAMYHTLDLYEQKGWKTYGGGRTYREGLQPIKINHNGNRIAFIGCNAKAGDKYATASETTPGASSCDFPWMKGQIQDLAAEGYLPIATMQHDEIYQYEANYLQQRDFRSLAESGAVIVSGSQAHQPQAVEFYENSFIHYGLGNLFFDQYYLAQRVKKYRHADEAFIDRHTFYNNRHISTELIPIKFLDNAQSRLMTQQERTDLLMAVFQKSTW